MIQAGSLPERMGFKTTKFGGHRARSMMSAELALLFQAVPLESPAERYTEAILDDNVLGKSTASNRRYSLQCIRDLYSLDPDVPLLRILHRLWRSESCNRPLLTFQCAYAREMLLRSTAGLIIGKRLGLTLSALRGRKRSSSASAKHIVKTEAELETWLVEVKGLVAEKLSDGQVSI